MTVIPDLEKQLVRAAARASAPPASPMRGRRVSVASAVAVAVIAVLVVAAGLGGGGGNANAAARVLEQAARTAASGLSATRLHPGQAWLTRELTMTASPWQPITPGQLPQTAILPSTHAVVESRSRSENWLFYDGNGRGRSRQVGRATFFGTRADRGRWTASGSHPTLVVANGGGVLMSDGFTVGDRQLSYRQVLDFPTDPTAVLKFLAAAEPAGSDTLETITTLLTQVPLLPAARAAVFRALAQLPGVRYLGHAHDPLGRAGVAIAIDRTATERTFTSNGPTNGAIVHLRSELIFNPQTAALLAQETLLLNPPQIPGVRAPFAAAWTAYLTSRIVPQTNAPTLRQLGYRPPPRPLLPSPTITTPPVTIPGATTRTTSPRATP